MKSIKRYFFVMMAIAAVFGFVACSDDDDPTAIAMFKGIEWEDLAVSFFSDGTFSVVDTDIGMITSGMYTDDPTENSGAVEVTVSWVNNEYEDFYTVGKTYIFMIGSNGNATVQTDILFESFSFKRVF